MSDEEKQDLLQRVFGMLKDPVRIYQIAEDREVERDEFQYCQVMYNVVFGDRGFAETLGPTWHMIHDPRFNVIEGLMIVDRHAIFGGDARLGKQYINDDGSFSSTVSDLEKYAEILGEGRNFHNVLVHPDPKCQVRLWLERIYRGFTNLKPYEGFKCTCNRELMQYDAASFKFAPDEDVWALIKQECPNRAVTQGGATTTYGQLMYDLIRADLIGLIHDYAETPLIDSYVYLRDHGVVTATESVAAIDPHGQDAPRVLQEIDILEQALTHRASLRVTAYKLLKKMGFDRKLAELAGEEFELTDLERDDLLMLIYEHSYPEGDTRDTFFRMKLHEWEKEIEKKVVAYIMVLLDHPDLSAREARQLAIEKTDAQEIVHGLKTGSIQPINHYTEPTAEIPSDQNETEVMKYAAMLEAILANEFKQELYLLMVSAEQRGDTAVVDILSPVFLSPDFQLDEQGFYQILERIRIGSRSLRAERMDAIRGTKQTVDKTGGHPELVETEGEFHSKDNPGGMLR